MIYSQIFHQIVYFPSEDFLFFSLRFSTLLFSENNVISVKLAQVLYGISSTSFFKSGNFLNLDLVFSINFIQWVVIGSHHYFSINP
jgi:hypothetical protein